MGKISHTHANKKQTLRFTLHIRYKRTNIGGHAVVKSFFWYLVTWATSETSAVIKLEFQLLSVRTNLWIFMK